MTLAIIFLLGLGLVIWGCLPSKQKPEPRYEKFTVALRKGDLEVYLCYESENPILPRLRKITQLWALELEKPVRGRSLFHALERELSKHFQDIEVMDMIPNIPESEKPHEPDISKPDRMARNQKLKRDCAEALAKDAGLNLDEDTIRGVPYQTRVKRDAEESINDLFHHPDHA